MTTKCFVTSFVICSSLSPPIYLTLTYTVPQTILRMVLHISHMKHNHCLNQANECTLHPESIGYINCSLLPHPDLTRIQVSLCAMPVAATVYLFHAHAPCEAGVLSLTIFRQSWPHIRTHPCLTTSHNSSASCLFLAQVQALIFHWTTTERDDCGLVIFIVWPTLLMIVFAIMFRPYNKCKLYVPVGVWERMPLYRGLLLHTLP